MVVIAKGAEAVLKRQGGFLVKERIKKSYRIDAIDNRLRKTRTRSEANLLRDAMRAGLSVPQLAKEEDFKLSMQFIEGMKLKDLLNESNCESIGRKIADAVARLHGYGIIHGDLTTSNMIMKDDRIYFIDFGLGFHSQKAEDKAIDLYLLHEALESTHFDVLKKIWKVILETYRKSYTEADKVIKTLANIEKRGRYKER